MRSIALWLMLVLALPGLLLPAGVLWHACRCQSLAPRTESTCCAHHGATATPGAEKQACCRHGNPRQPAPGDGTSASAACGCTWIAIGEDRAEPAPLPAPPQPALPPLEAGARVPALVPPLVMAHPAWLAAASRPPPDRQRSLPLRL